MAQDESLPMRPNTVAYYDAFAQYYDTETQAAGLPAKVEALVAGLFELKPKEEVRTVLDLGAGTGITVGAIKKHANPRRIIAVDPSAGMLAHLRNKHSSEELTIVTDSMQGYVGYCDEKFDLITSTGVLELLPDAPEAVSDASQLLNPGGLLAVTYAPLTDGEDREIFSDDSESLIASTMMEYRWTPEEIEEAMTSRGLKIVGRVDGVRVQEQDAETDTAERNYNFVVAMAPQS